MPDEQENKSARKILITAGPAVEEIDAVRKIINHSTGALGTALTEWATMAGHDVTLLRSRHCTAPAPQCRCTILPFSTSHDLARELEKWAGGGTFDAVWHAAAIGDFQLDRITDAEGRDIPSDQKIDSRAGGICLHLVPAPKLIGRLEAWFPDACRVGWKYETDGTREEALAKGMAQIRDNQTQASVVNGPAVGPGFLVCTGHQEPVHCPSPESLGEILISLI